MRHEGVEKEILDACCGGRMMWFNKHYAGALYVDKRVRPRGFMQVRPDFAIEPDIQGDFTDLDFPARSFSLVVFDPPHTIRSKEVGGIIAERYGRLTIANWQQDLALGFAECWRVLKPNGTLIFKWAESDKPIEALRPFFPAEPIFGTRAGKNHKTVWLVFFKARHTKLITRTINA
jgi:SAM-dependent methyltransferase